MEKIQFNGGTMLNPVPVVLVTSKNSSGSINVFTVAWAGTACTKPPMLTIAVRPERLSYEYIKETMSFIINLPSEKLTKKVDYCGVKSGRIVDKIKEMGFTLSQGAEIDCPIIEDCPISLECKVKSITPLGSHHLFLAEIVKVHVDANLIDKNGKIHFEKAKLIQYCHGEYYPMPEHSIGTFGFSVQKQKHRPSAKK